MNEWLKDNAWSLIIAVCGIATTFMFYGFRIASLENQVLIANEKIAKLDSQQNEINVQLAGIAKDIQYIKERISQK